MVCPLTRLDTKRRVIALTLDACGGRGPGTYDREMIEYLKQEHVPATLFINARWAQAHPAVFTRLCSDPLFDIASHGYRHCPCTIAPAERYGIEATSSIPALVEEVERSSRVLQKLGARFPRYFRSGTAWYDECSIHIIEEMGYRIVNFDVNSRDYDRFAPAEKIAGHILEAKPGSIIIMHMNRPGSNSLAALKIAVPQLRERGYTFVHLSGYRLIHVMRTRLPR
ncbi:MAG: polysaccharide deacetylase family protein [Spirochaetota bacterium]